MGVLIHSCCPECGTLDQGVQINSKGQKKEKFSRQTNSSHMPQRHTKLCRHNRVIICRGVYKINGCQHKMVVCLCGCVCHPQASNFTHTTGMVIQCRQWVREDARPCMHTQPTSCMCTSSQPAHFEQSPNHRPKSQTLPVFTQKIPANLYHVLTSLCCHLQFQRCVFLVF